MKKSIFILPFALSLFLLPSCEPVLAESMDSGPSIPKVQDTNISINESGLNIDSAPESAIAGHQNLSNRGIRIDLADGDSTCNDNSRVHIDNDNNIITIKSVGEYVISGDLSDGLILNEAPALDNNDTVKILMNGAFIKSNGNQTITVGEKTIIPGPIYSTGSSTLLLEVPEETASVVVDGRDNAIVGEQNDAGIYSYSRIKFRGKGSLRVNSFCNNGIESKKSIDAFGLTLAVLTPGSCLKATNSIVLGRAEECGSFIFFSSGEAGHGVEVTSFDSNIKIPVYGNTEENDDIAGVEIKDGSYFMKAPGSAIYSEGHVYMEGGEGMIESTDNHSIYSFKELFVDGGSFYLKAENGCGIYSDIGSVFVKDGSYSMDVGQTTWCDGIRAERNIEIRGGYIAVNNGYRGFLAQKIVTSGGTTLVNALDDGWKADTIDRERANTLIDVSGGNHFINAEGDGIDSAGRLIMRSGLLVIVASKDNYHSTLEAGEGEPIEINGGTLIAYGNNGQVNSLSGTQNTVVVKNHSKLSPNNYYIFRAGNSYYAMKVSKESSSVSASFGEFRNNEYAILTADRIIDETVIWDNAGFYKVRSFNYRSTICSGSFSAANNQHPEHTLNLWGNPYSWGYRPF